MKGASSNSQLIADTVVQWSFENKVKLNSEKCKELTISFAKNKPQLAPIVVNNQELESGAPNVNFRKISVRKTI